jgi:hydroxypyruvate reductase
VISSGETTVRVRGAGRGGRNQEFALALVEPLGGVARPVAMASLGTDGIDGPTDAAGAIVDCGTALRARQRGLRPPSSYLDENDSYAFFDALSALLRTGPTGTNVGDIQLLVAG